MPNPFDLRGPEFLVFYLVLGIVTLVAVAWIRWSNESDTSPPRPLHDYLEIAFLRGGAAEAVRVAILTLIHRELLAVAGDGRMRVARDDAPERVTKATERWILQRCRSTSRPNDLISDSIVTSAATHECERALIDHGLLPNDDQRARRLYLFALGAVALVTVAAIKIGVALARGRTNVEFLVIAAVAFVVLAGIVAHPRRTPAGSALLADLRTLFAGLRERARSLQPFTDGSDFALLAAVFGVSAALPLHPEAQPVFRRTRASSSGNGCGSSCGSSCGGGCGGGCGGCGS